MKVINLFGGPGCGKSTNAALVFGALKNAGVNCEYVPEFAKELTWKKSPEREDQIYIFGEQFHRLYTLRGQVECVVTDSPLLLSLKYMTWGCSGLAHVKWQPAFTELVYQCHSSFRNKNFVINRGNRVYNPKGRNQTEAEAKQIDDDLVAMLTKIDVPFEKVNGAAEVIAAVQNWE